jgi:DNA-binding response OmpR family regulator
MKKKIIVIEDDPALQDIFELVLSKRGYQVVLLSEERQLMNCEGIEADLVLLDLHLAGFSGVDVCRRLKSCAQTSNIPVVMISADPNIHHIAEKAGADSSIEKPFDMQHFLQVIAFHIDKERVFQR